MDYLREITDVSRIVLEAGKLVNQIYNSEFSVSMKQKDDPVTNADTEANRIITDGIQEKYPDDGILSEESSDDLNRLKNDRVWIIDPIDGTREFVSKRDEFCISVGLSKNHRSVLGIILNPATFELFLGIVGVGVFYKKLDSKLQFDFSEIKFEKKTRRITQENEIAVSRSEFHSGVFDKQKLWKLEYKLKPIGSIAYKLALVALGFFPTTVSLKRKNEWDICAGVGLIEASGKIAFDLEKKEFTFNQSDPIRTGIVAGDLDFVERFWMLKDRTL